MIIRKPRGTQDFLPARVSAWNYVEDHIKKLCKIYGLGEVITPIFENTNLFLRGIGETTDVVQKEMYTFSTGDKKESFTLRPENTASSVRAYIENKVYGEENLTKWFYIGPMFRHDRPQAGRYRQFHQFGVEVFGSASAYIDAETIALVLQIFNSLGLKDLSLELNSVGCPHCRPKYRQALLDYFEPVKEDLCHDCQNRLEKNPLRVLDCKVDTEKGINAPKITDYLCSECHDHFEKLKELLDIAGIKYNLNARLVRGLDYYTKTAFEIKYTPLGAQSAIAGGGRYDGLVRELGGNDTPAFGFAVGMERLILALENQNLLPQNNESVDICIVALGEEAHMLGFKIQQSLRQNDITVIMDADAKSMKSQLKNANKANARYAIIIGSEELANNNIIWRDMQSSEQIVINLDSLDNHINQILKG